MSMVFNVQNGLECNNVNAVRLLRLPSSRLQWEANSAAIWEQRAGMSSNDNLQTVGDLLDVHGHCEEPAHARKLDSWNAKTDQFGLLLNLAVDML
jgi:hypothetical protein